MSFFNAVGKVVAIFRCGNGSSNILAFPKLAQLFHSGSVQAPRYGYSESGLDLSRLITWFYYQLTSPNVPPKQRPLDRQASSLRQHGPPEVEHGA